MSKMVRQSTTETIELSDSDSDPKPILNSSTTENTRSLSSTTCEAVDDQRLRRSSRRRRSSTRFSNFITEGDEPATTAASKITRKRTATLERHSFLSEPEPVDPTFLIGFAEKTNKVVVSGQYIVKLPVGPDEYVTQDGAEYLRGLGYHNTLIEEEIMGVEPKRIKEVTEPDQFSSASAYSSDEDNEVSTEEIDVLGPASPSRFDEEPPSPIILQNSSTKTSPGSDSDHLEGERRRRRPPDNIIRLLHNESEKMRRKNMAECFDYLWKCVCHGSDESPGSKVPKVKILAESVSLISKLIEEEKALTSLKSQELATNLTLQTMAGETEKTQLPKKRKGLKKGKDRTAKNEP